MQGKTGKGNRTEMKKETLEALRVFKAEIFQILSNPTRIHIIECLRDGEMSVGEILEQVCIEPTNASQHLALLRARRLVISRKEGNQVFYSLRDPMLMKVLDLMRQYFVSHLEESMSMLKEI